jgi:hypothetical protein
MRKKLDEILQDSARNGQLISESNISRVDDDIIIALHGSDVLDTIKKNRTGHRNISIIEIDGGAFLGANTHYITIRSLSRTCLGWYQKPNFLVP